ncbi:MAG: cobalt ECF transporter T component CbiQ [Bryobacteraceae bacterium]
MARLHDRYCDLDSPLHRADPRAKLIAFTLAVVAVASLSADDLTRFAWAYAAIASLLALSRVPPAYLLRRMLAVSPIILTSGLLLYFASSSQNPAPALAIILRAYAAVALLALLGATTPFQHVLWAFRKLRLPESLYAIASLMNRYFTLLHDQWRRMINARDCRSAGKPAISHTSLYGKQIALVFLRSWDRAERVHAAMAARGFHGEIPVNFDHRFRLADLALATLCPALFFAPQLPVVNFRLQSLVKHVADLLF